MRKKSLLALLLALIMVFPMYSAQASQAETFGNTVAIAQNFTLVIDEDGILWSFGDNQFGQLGDGTNVTRTSPVQVLEDVVHVAAGANHALAITADGTLWAWGDNRAGQIGTGTIGGTVLIPTAVMNNIAYAGAHDNFSYAISHDNSLWYWGQNIFQGEVGHFRFAMVGEDNVRTPRNIMERVDFVTTNGRVMAVIRTDDTLMMWGSNMYGVIGDGTMSMRERQVITYEIPGSGNSPGNSPGNPSPEYYDNDNEYENDENDYLNDYGYEEEEEEEDEEEDLPPPPELEPVQVITPIPAVNNDHHSPVPILPNVAYVTLGDNHVLALTRNADLFAWGNNEFGQIGLGFEHEADDIPAITTPTHVANGIRAIDSGANHSLAVDFNNNLLVWGQNDRGQLGDGGIFGPSLNIITRNANIGGVVDIWANGRQSAAIAGNALYLWGENQNQSIGDGTTIDRQLPARILTDAEYVWLAGTHTFAADAQRNLWAWGGNEFGQLGNGTRNPASTPVLILDNVALPGEELTFTPATDEPEPTPTPPPIEVGDVLHPDFYAIDFSLLDGIETDLDAISAIRSVVMGMNTAQRANRDNADNVTRFAEHAIMNALTEYLDVSRIIVNNSFLAQYEAAVGNLAQMAQNDIRANNLTIDRRVENILRIVLPAEAAEITVDPSIQHSAIDRVVVNVGDIDVIIDGRQIHDTFTITVPLEAINNAAANAYLGHTNTHSGVRFIITGTIANNSRVRMGIPAIQGAADRNQTIFNGDGANIGGMVNPNTGRIETVLFSNMTLIATHVNRSFDDIYMIPGAQQDAILYLRNKGRVGGRTETIFDPLSPINRAEFATMLLMALTEYDMAFGTGGFTDVEGMWYAPFAGMARHRGYISGFAHVAADGSTYYTFEPRVNIPRVQLIAISGRVLLQGRGYFEVDGAAFLARYHDFAEIPVWAHGHIAVMGNAGLFDDINPSFFNPNFEMNRAEAATIIYNLYRRLY